MCIRPDLGVSSRLVFAGDGKVLSKVSCKKMGDAAPEYTSVRNVRIREYSRARITRPVETRNPYLS
jgi:hypothetical protein